MWLVGMMFGHTLEDRANILGISGPGSSNNCVHCRFVRLDAGRQPQSGRASPFGNVSCAILECSAAEGYDEPRHNPEIFE